MKSIIRFCFFFIISATTTSGASAMSRSRLIIKEPIDLKGDTLELPLGCRLVFKNDGCLMNGVVNGDRIAVTSAKKHIFKNIILCGSYIASLAYSDWFDIKSDCKLDKDNIYVAGTDNLQGFKNLFLFEKIMIESGFYMISGGLRCIDSQVIDGNGATIKCLNRGACISIISEMEEPIKWVTVKNLNIIGSKVDYSDETEYWHGIYMENAQKICIDGVNISLCRGDGIYIGGIQKEGGDNRIPCDITIKDVNCYKNHRQGLSITRGENICIERSNFSETSGTLPSCGVDIEPNMNLSKGYYNKCKNIRFFKCKFEDNKNPGLIISAKEYDFSYLSDLITNIEIIDCTFRNNDLCVYGVNGLKMSNSSLTNGGIIMNSYGLIQNVNIDGVTVDFETDNTACGFQLSLIEQPCKNVNVSNFTALNCGVFGLYVTRSSSTSNLGLSQFQLDGLTLKNIIITNCCNSVFVSENARNVTYDGITIKGNGINRLGNKMISKYGRNIYFEKLDDKESRKDL